MPSRFKALSHQERKLGSLAPDAWMKRRLCDYALAILPSIAIGRPYTDFVASLVDRHRLYLRFAMSAKRMQPEGSDEDAPSSEDELVKMAKRLPRGESQCILKEELTAAFPANRWTIVRRRLNDLTRTFRLTRPEAEAVLFVYAYTQSPEFEMLCDIHAPGQYLKLASLATGVSARTLRTCLSKSGRLYLMGFFEDGAIDPLLVPTSALVAHLSGLGNLSPGDAVSLVDKEPALPLDQFSVDASDTAIVRGLVRSCRPVHILIYGDAGTGKTQFSRSLVKAAGMKPNFVLTGDIGRRPDRTARKLALNAAVIVQDPKSSVLIVDESDDILNTRTGGVPISQGQNKGWVNAFMDHAKGPMIWIVNTVDGIPESTMRRFAYSMHFGPFNQTQREAVWGNLLRDHPFQEFVTPATVRKLSEQYPVNAAGIDSALKAVSHVLNRRKEVHTETVHRILCRLLERHMEVTGIATGNRVNALTDKYDLRAIRTSVDVEVILKSLTTFTGRQTDATARQDMSMNLLFWGNPGTGKTEFAKHVAAETGRSLLIRRTSDLLSMWVGGTERNIAECFAQARRDRAILLLDEADSLFINRETALRSWEASQTNELLMRMETHGGILICCTNMLDHLDAAAMRRFAWKVRFDPPDMHGRIALYKRYFGAACDPSPAEIERISAMNGLTAGDFKAVWQKLQFTLPDLSPSQIVDNLADELSYHRKKGGPIGFSALCAAEGAARESCAG